MSEAIPVEATSGDIAGSAANPSIDNAAPAPVAAESSEPAPKKRKKGVTTLRLSNGCNIRMLITTSHAIVIKYKR